MKTKILIIVIALVSAGTFAQKKEIRNAKKAMEEANYSEAKALLQQAEPEIADEKDKVKADYYLAKGKVYLGPNDGANTSMDNLMTAVEAFQKATSFGSEEAGNGILAVRNALVQSAVADQNNQQFSVAAEKLYQSYMLGEKKDTLFLYSAASNAVNAQDYETALTYYNELMELGYDGSETVYSATDKETGESRPFASKKERDLFVQSGQYIKPTEEKTPSKKREIAKNTALIYLQLEQPEKAMQAMEKAKAESPDDLQLLQVEANMYYRMGKIEVYNEMMKEIIRKDPENPEMYYNIAISSLQLGDQESAIEYFKKAIQYDPQMENAYINLAVAILTPENDIVEGMNQALEAGNNKKYDELAQKRDEMYTEAMPYLEKAHEINPNNPDAVRTLMNIYYVLGNPKAEEMQAKMKELNAKQ